MSYDLQKNKILKLEDVFEGDYKMALRAQLENAYRKAYKVPNHVKLPEGYLLTDHIDPTDNFILTDKGILFGYSPYEIAAYAMGQVNLFVPFEEIKSIVQSTYLPK
jgi:hypothetical protein